jgi:hypothetical protein
VPWASRFEYKYYWRVNQSRLRYARDSPIALDDGCFARDTRLLEITLVQGKPLVVPTSPHRHYRVALVLIEGFHVAGRCPR